MGEKEVKNRPKLIDKTVFECFNKLTSASDEDRVKGASNLISFLDKNDDEEKALKARNYALKRLIRGVGSSNNASRSGFFAAFVGYLNQEKDREDGTTATEIFQIAKKELALDSDEKGEAKLDVKLGKLLVCGSMIRSDFIENATDIELQNICKALKKGIYKMLTPIMYQFLSELVQKIETDKFSSIVWPIFEDVFNVKKEEHDMNTVQFLMVASEAHKKPLTVKYFKNNWGSPKILHKENYKFLAKLMYKIPTTIAINHPFYEYFIDQLIKINEIGDFWKFGVEKMLNDKDEDFKYTDVVTLRLGISILTKMEDFSEIPKILSDKFVAFLTENVKKIDELSEDMRELYVEFFEALNNSYSKIKEEPVKLEIFKVLVNRPCTILIEKYANNKIVHNLVVTMNEDGLKSVGEQLKVIILNKSSPEFLNSERIYAAHMLQKILTCKNVVENEKWRTEQMKFFINFGIFNSDETEIAPTMKNIFFHCLQVNSQKLVNEKNILMEIVSYINENLTKISIPEEIIQIWRKMYKNLDEKKIGNEKIRNVFHVLMMHMGLHLFKDTELATSSINELESVMSRVQKKKSNEPEWIEVVVDLFLHLMSQNSGLLRNVIRHVFPHLAGEINLTAFNQILSVINLKDKTNPLSAAGDNEEEGDEEMADEEENGKENGNEESSDESDDDEEAVNGEKESDEDAEDDQEEEEDDDDDDLMDQDEEEDKVTDQMRMALHKALGNANPETDTESVDLDDMDEEEGKKLDEALSAAFKLLKKSKKSKPTKEDKKVDTTLVHFRMRVFDLIDLYIKSTPDMAICLELMLYIFEMLPVAIKETKFKAILNRYSNILNNLIKIKQFNVSQNEVTSTNLAQILDDLMEKVAKGASFPDKHTYLLKACQFIILCSQNVEKANKCPDDDEVAKIFAKYFIDFLSHRNPVMSINIFQTIFSMNWKANVEMIKILVENGLQSNVRTLRKTQTLQLIRILLKNRSLLTSHEAKVAENVKILETKLMEFINSLPEHVSQNEFSELLQLLIEIQRLQQQHNLKNSNLNWSLIGEIVQKRRNFHINAMTMNFYRKLCHLLQIIVISNSEITVAAVNGNAVNGDVNHKEPNVEANEGNRGKKRKKKNAGTLKKEKRLKKEQRLKNASTGLESISFAKEVE